MIRERERWVSKEAGANGWKDGDLGSQGGCLRLSGRQRR